MRDMARQIKCRVLQYVFKCVCVVILVTVTTSNLKSEEWIVDENLTITGEVVPELKLQLRFILKNGAEGWAAVFFHEFFFPADGIVVWFDESLQEGICWDAYNPGIPTLSNFPAPLQDNDPIFQLEDGSPENSKNNCKVISASKENGEIDILVERDLITNDVFDFQIYQGRNFYVHVAYNMSLTFVNEFEHIQPAPTKQVGFIWRF